MLFDIEPSRRITGGAWYSEQEFDSEFIEMLQKQAYLFILNKVGCYCLFAIPPCNAKPLDLLELSQGF